MAEFDDLTIEELKRKLEELTEIVNEHTKTNKKLEESSTNLKKKGLDPVTDAFIEMTKGGKDLITSFSKGDRGFKVLDSAVDLTAGALKGLLTWLPGAGKGIDAVAGAAKMLNTQMERQVEGFQSLGETGALTEAGLEGFQKSMLDSGLTLDDYTKRIASSSTTLARFQGLTGTGAETFAKITHQLTQTTDVTLRRLGLSAEQM